MYRIFASFQKLQNPFVNWGLVSICGNTKLKLLLLFPVEIYIKGGYFLLLIYKTEKRKIEKTATAKGRGSNAKIKNVCVYMFIH